MTQGNGEPGVPAPSPAGDDLDKLVLTVARGEHGAFDALFRQLSGPVYRAALDLTRDRAQAEEIAQDVLFEIWRTADRFDPGKGSATAWARMIARRRAIDRIRSVAADAQRESRTAVDPVCWDQVSEAVEEGLDREQLTSSLNQLSGLQRQAIMLAFYSGHTHQEIAAILDIALGTVKSRIRTGLHILRDYMHTGHLAALTDPRITAGAVSPRRAGAWPHRGREDRDVRLELRPLAPRAVPPRASRGRPAGPIRGYLPHRRAQQQLLPLAAARGVPELAGPAA
jgi:RNA polymerase sigma-70 factor (ECF subfamily)